MKRNVTTQNPPVALRRQADVDQHCRGFPAFIIGIIGIHLARTGPSIAVKLMVLLMTLH